MKFVEDKAEAVKQKQRDALTARFWGELKKGERYDKYGTSPAIKLALDIINEVETCEDPAHFQSKVLAGVSPAKLHRASAEYIKNRPARRPEVQAAMDTYTDMTNFLAQNHKARSGQPPPKPRRGARKSVRHHPAKPAPAPEPGSEDGDFGEPSTSSVESLSRAGLKMEDGNPSPPSSILQTPSSPSSAAAPAPPDPSNPQSAIRNPQSGLPPSPIVSNRV